MALLVDLFGTRRSVVRSFVRPRPGLWDSVLAGVILVAMVGFRHEVGPDCGTYLDWQEELGGADLWSAFHRYPHLGYTLLNCLGANGLGGIYFVNLICAGLGVVPLVLFCRAQRNPRLALMVAIPYLLTAGYMGFSRQGAATGLGMLAVTQKRTLLFVAKHYLGCPFPQGCSAVFRAFRQRYMPRAWTGGQPATFPQWLSTLSS